MNREPPTPVVGHLYVYQWPRDREYADFVMLVRVRKVTQKRVKLERYCTIGVNARSWVPMGYRAAESLKYRVANDTDCAAMAGALKSWRKERRKVEEEVQQRYERALAELCGQSIDQGEI